MYNLSENVELNSDQFYDSKCTRTYDLLAMIPACWFRF